MENMSTVECILYLVLKFSYIKVCNKIFNKDLHIYFDNIEFFLLIANIPNYFLCKINIHLIYTNLNTEDKIQFSGIFETYIQNVYV